MVDKKTARELYFPPFVAAIEAGVGGAMCSYNKVDGVHSCSNHHILTEVLKGELGFQGFVQSDWWAVHQPSFVEGLDQEMPGAAPEVFLRRIQHFQAPRTSGRCCHSDFGCHVSRQPARNVEMLAAQLQ